MRIFRPTRPDWQQEYLEQMLSIIDEHGVAIQGVGASESEPEFAHTVGLAAVGHPELIIFGIPRDVVQSLLNPLAAVVLGGRGTYGHGDTVHRLAVGFPVRLIGVDDSRTHLRLANTFYATGPGTRGRVPALQVVYPDPEMRWPWEPGSGVAWMPLLGPIPAEGEGRVQTMPGSEDYAESFHD